MFKTVRKAVKKYMDKSLEKFEKILTNKDLRKIFGGGCIGVGAMCLKDCFKNNIYTKAGVITGCFTLGLIMFGSFERD